MRRIALSNSKRSWACGCLKAFDYFENRRLRRIGTEDKFHLGTLYHTWMEVFFLEYQKGIIEAMREANSVLVEASREHAPLICSMGRQTVYSLRRSGFFDRYVVMATEWPFRLNVTPSGVHLLKDGEEGYNEFVGVVDVVLFDKMHNCYLPMDHKSTTDKIEPWLAGMHYSWQLAGYAVAVNQGFGTIAQESLYSVARKKIPSVPHINKNGSLSIRPCDTTREVIETLDVDVPTGYIEKHTKHPYHWLAPRRITEADYEEWHADLLHAFSEYRRRLRSDRYPRQAWHECKECDYRDLCFAPGDEHLFLDNFETVPETIYPHEFEARNNEDY